MNTVYRSMKVVSILALSVFLIIIVGCSDQMKPPYHLGNESINASQFGFIVQDDEWLYYTNQKNQISGTNESATKIYDNTYGRGLNVYGDYIYFLPLASDSNGKTGVYRVHKENTNHVEQIVKDTHISGLIIVNDSLYYSRFGESNNGLYRSNLKGQQEEQLLRETINGFQFYDGWFYTLVSSGGKVLKISSNGKEVGKLETEDGRQISTTKLIINDDWIYFENIDEEFDERYADRVPDGFNNIYRMKLDGSSLEYLTKANQGSLSLVDDTPNIYFMFQEKSGEEKLLIRMNADTKERDILYSGDKDLIWGNKIGNHLFFIDWETNPKNNTVIYKTNTNGNKLEAFEENSNGERIH